MMTWAVLGVGLPRTFWHRALNLFRARGPASNGPRRCLGAGLLIVDLESVGTGAPADPRPSLALPSRE
ncbi:hypothetical protein [Cellulomonas hominis]|uniref:hypothetical protein n=1 Tax=Cellulomonas hominis TaxID=156981 RepID=UPI0014448B76|nr:hypothetical protein [Cellulomonas hominis]